MEGVLVVGGGLLVLASFFGAIWSIAMLCDHGLWGTLGRTLTGQADNFWDGEFPRFTPEGRPRYPKPKPPGGHDA